MLRTSYIQREGLKVRFPDGGVERVIKKASKKGIRIKIARIRIRFRPVVFSAPFLPRLKRKELSFV